MAAYFYADNRLLALTRVTQLQQYFYTLVDLFECVFLPTNMVKVVSMACQPYRALGGNLADAYGLQMIG